MADEDRPDVGEGGPAMEFDQEKWRHLLASDDPYDVLEWHDLSLAMYGSIHGISQAVVDLRAMQIPRACMSGQHVLVTGETGTGKELVVREIAENSERKGRFLPVNCAAVPADRFEADMFGWVEGGFTGATRENPGLLKEADGGCLFLDELGEVPTHVQAKLLRFVEDQQFSHLGETERQHVDVRLFAATNNPEALRDDILWRLGEQIHLPPLRERLSDVFVLLQTSLPAKPASSSRENPNRDTDRRGLQWAIGPHTLVRMVMSDWPGNVRELKNAVSTSVATWAHTLDLGGAPRQGLRIPFSYAPRRGRGEMLHDPLAISFIWSDWVHSIKGTHLKANGLTKKRLAMIDKFFCDTSLPLEAMESGLIERRYADEARRSTDDTLPMFTWGEALRFLCAMSDSRAGGVSGISRPDGAPPRQYTRMKRSLVLKLHLLDQHRGAVFRLPGGVADAYQQDGTRKPADHEPDLSGFTEKELLRLYYAQLGRIAGGVQKDMAERAGFSSQTVARRMKDLGLK